MKLNLLPTYVSKEKQGKTAWFFFAALAIAGIFVAVLMVVVSQGALKAAREEEAESRTRADAAKAQSDIADAYMADPKTNSIVRNVLLAQAMDKHNSVYPDLYDHVRQYIPSYFRVISMSAGPGDAETCTVTLTGVISSYQEYADLGLAMLRIPGAVSYTPSGYQVTDTYTPPLTPEDQLGRPIKPGETNIPDDPLKRLAYYQSQGRQSGYLGLNNYGLTDPTLTKGAMPESSQVTVVVTLKSDPKTHFDANIQTPDPRATLSSAIGTGAAPATSAPAAFGGPPAGGAPVGGPPPADTPPAGKGRKGKGDDSSD